MISRAALCLAAALLALCGCDRNSGESDPGPASQSPVPITAAGAVDRSHSGEPLPEFAFSDPTGKVLRIADLTGKPVLINLWATWCGPCVAEMPTLDRLAAEDAGSLRVITISQDPAGAPVAEFLASHGLKHLEPWLDPEGKIDYHFNTGHFPTTVYYDAKGREVWRYVGGRDWGDGQTPGLLVEGMLR